MRYFYFGFMFYFAVSACTHNKLQGTWKTECTPLGRHASVSEVVFEGNHFKSNGYLFERKGCAVNTVHAQMNGTYSIDSKENFNYTPLTFKLSLLKNDVVEHYNKKQICGFTDWKINTPKNILGRQGCVGLFPPNKGQEIYDLYQLKTDNELVFAIFPIGKGVTNKSKRPKQIPNYAFRFKSF